VATVIRNLIRTLLSIYPKGAITNATVVDRFIKITVTDNGIGISKEEMHNLFIVDYKNRN
jgi:signal transduction histidine kinase